MNQQLNLWKSEFGAEYAKRNQYSTKDDSTRAIIRNFSRVLARTGTEYPETALEIGCNLGANLVALKNLVKSVSGVEPNEKVCAMIKDDERLEDVHVHNADGFKLPFENSSYDFVFTSGVLIHVAPEFLGKMTDEIVRVSKRFVFCAEYFNPDPVTLPYRGMGDGFLFKQDYGSHYMDRYPQLELVDHGFFWRRVDGPDDLNWWLFKKRA